MPRLTQQYREQPADRAPPGADRCTSRGGRTAAAPRKSRGSASRGAAGRARRGSSTSSPRRGAAAPGAARASRSWASFVTTSCVRHDPVAGAHDVLCSDRRCRAASFTARSRSRACVRDQRGPEELARQLADTSTSPHARAGVGVQLARRGLRYCAEREHLIALHRRLGRSRGARSARATARPAARPVAVTPWASVRSNRLHQRRWMRAPLPALRSDTPPPAA